MRVLVATITHRADDARIFARQIPAMLNAGIDLTVVAPWRASGVQPDPRVRAIDVPRTRGRRRLGALVRAVRIIKREPADLVLVHDPELAFVLAHTRLRDRVIWDVHEDVPATLRSKAYLPASIRPLLAGLAAHVERRAEQKLRGLLLAEERYQERFRRKHPLVLNLPRVPELVSEPEVQRRVVYVGSITRARGLTTMLEIAKRLERDHISLLLIGEIPSASDREAVKATPNLRWTGPLANEHALELVQSSIAGLALLADMPNYRHSMPTKVLEYMSRGVPVITTPLPVAVAALDGHGTVVSFDADKAVGEAVEAIRAIADNKVRRSQQREGAYERVRTHYSWDVAQADFIAALKAF